MGASLQSLQHLSCAVPLPAEIVSLGGYWGVFQLRLEVVRMESTRKRSAELLECFQAVLEALEVRLEMTAPVQ
jgi:hypothetical protein